MRRWTPTGPWRRTPGKTGGGGLAYAVTGLNNATVYDVQVRAVDEDDVDGAWSVSTSSTPADHGDERDRCH